MQIVTYGLGVADADRNIKRWRPGGLGMYPLPRCNPSIITNHAPRGYAYRACLSTTLTDCRLLQSYTDTMQRWPQCIALQLTYFCTSRSWTSYAVGNEPLSCRNRLRFRCDYTRISARGVGRGSRAGCQKSWRRFELSFTFWRSPGMLRYMGSLLPL